MKSITLLIPVYNEKSVLPQLFSRLDKFAKSTPNYQFEFLFINDGSVMSLYLLLPVKLRKIHASATLICRATSVKK